jgi:DNA-binding response OmpR family regulator
MKPVRVLLIEDSAGDVLLTQQATAELQVPVKFTVARDGEQALILLSDQDFKPDLIILDLNIPRITGQGFLERYKQRDAPIVVFSSSQNMAEIQRALALGVRECAQKPSNLDEFNAVVRAIIRKWMGRDDEAQAQPQPPLERSIE